MEKISDFTLKVKSFKEMESPFSVGRSSGIKRYVMFANIEGLNKSFKKWFQTNPRHQNINRKISKDIRDSLRYRNEIFHNLNKGLLFSAKDLTFYRNLGEVHFYFENPDIHGNIDGGHTLEVINNHKEEQGKIKETYVFVEIITGLRNVQEVVEIASARNRTVQVDLTSIANLEKKFDPIKNLLENRKICFRNRIIYKMNERKLTKDSSDDPQFEKKEINIRDIVVVSSMFNLDLYSNKPEDLMHPIKCYNSKDKALEDFINLDKGIAQKNKFTTNPSRNILESVSKMEFIFEDIFKLYELIEKEFPEAYNLNKKKYGSRKDVKSYKGRKSKFTQQDLSNVPKVTDSIIFPILGAFRLLVSYNELTNKLEWKISPFELWNQGKKQLAGTIASLIDENKEWERRLSANKSLWQSLFSQVLALSYSTPREKEHSVATNLNSTSGLLE